MAQQKGILKTSSIWLVKSPPANGQHNKNLEGWRFMREDNALKRF